MKVYSSENEKLQRKVLKVLLCLGAVIVLVVIGILYFFR